MSTATASPPRAGSVSRKVRRRGPAVVLGVVALCIYAFLYLPAVGIALYSFNASAVMSWPLDGLTLHWYSVAFHDEDLVTGVKNSVVVALSSTSIAMLVGVPAGVAIDRYPFPGKAVFTTTLPAASVSVPSICLSARTPLLATTTSGPSCAVRTTKPSSLAEETGKAALSGSATVAA